MQYGGLKAMSLALLDDEESAKICIESAIQRFKALMICKYDAYATLRIAIAFALKWDLTREEQDWREALRYFKEVPEDELTPRGKARLKTEIGFLYHDHEYHDQAIGFLQNALSLDKDFRTVIGLSSSHLAMNDVKSAQLVLETIKADEVPNPFLLEYWRTQGAIGLASNNATIVRKSLAHLRKIEIKESYHRSERDSICVELIEYLSTRSQQPVKAKSTGLIGRLCQLTQYLELKPNLCGIGINFNKVISPPDDAKKDASEHI
jgi:hypothetical protein